MKITFKDLSLPVKRLTFGDIKWSNGLYLVVDTMGETKSPRFLLIANSSVIYIEPDKNHIGCVSDKHDWMNRAYNFVKVENSELTLKF